MGLNHKTVNIAPERESSATGRLEYLLSFGEAGGQGAAGDKNTQGLSLRRVKIPGDPAPYGEAEAVQAEESEG